MTKWFHIHVGILVGALGATGFAFAAAPVSAPATFDRDIQPFIAKHCIECHDQRKHKGDLRLDQLKPDFADETSRKQWRLVLDRVKSGEMPPESKPRPQEKEIQAVTQWISLGANAADVAQRATEGRVVLRRLNRFEYERTVLLVI